MLSTFLSEATLNNFWVKFVIMLLSNNRFCIAPAGCAGKDQGKLVCKVEKAAWGSGEKKMRVHFEWGCEMKQFCSFIYCPNKLIIAQNLGEID